MRNSGRANPHASGGEQTAREYPPPNFHFENSETEFHEADENVNAEMWKRRAAAKELREAIDYGVAIGVGATIRMPN